MLEQLLIYLATGAVSGLLAGLLGVGGGIVIVPALLLTLHLRGIDGSVSMHVAVATSLAIIVLTSISSIRAHHRRGAVQWPVVRRITPGIVIGALSGAALADVLSGDTLRTFFGFFALLLAAYLGLARPPEPHRALPGASGMHLAGLLIGSISALVGIGGGSLSVPFLVWHNVPVRKAVATAASIGLPIALGGAFGFAVTGIGAAGVPPYSLGYIDLAACLLVSLSSVPMAPLGARLAHAIDPLHLRRVFAVLLLVIGVRMLLA